MNIDLFKLILNLLIIPSMIISFSMIADGNIVGYILFIVLILMSTIINGDDKHKWYELRFT
mgnify:CR=1 FL=1